MGFAVDDTVDMPSGYVSGAVDHNGAALVVSHGGAIEPALVACQPDADHAAWGEPFSHCHGARLGFADGRFVSIVFDRTPNGSGITD